MVAWCHYTSLNLVMTGKRYYLIIVMHVTSLPFATKNKSQ